MDRRHLRSQDRIVLAHVLCEGDFFDGGLMHPALCLLGVADADGCDQ